MARVGVGVADFAAVHAAVSPTNRTVQTFPLEAYLGVIRQRAAIGAAAAGITNRSTASQSSRAIAAEQQKSSTVRRPCRGKRWVYGCLSRDV